MSGQRILALLVSTVRVRRKTTDNNFVITDNNFVITELHEIPPLIYP